MKPTISTYINLQKHHETEEHENEQPQPHCQMTVDSIACDGLFDSGMRKR